MMMMNFYSHTNGICATKSNALTVYVEIDWFALRNLRSIFNEKYASLLCWTRRVFFFLLSNNEKKREPNVFKMSK